jgi:hypothetical protein
MLRHAVLGGIQYPRTYGVVVPLKCGDQLDEIPTPRPGGEPRDVLDEHRRRLDLTYCGEQDWQAVASVESTEPLAA